MMIQAIQNPAPPSFESLVELHYEPLFRFAISLCGTPEGALDLTQQTFYLALRRIEQLRERGKFKSWLFSILLREFLQHRRHATKFRHHALEDCEHELPRVHSEVNARIDAPTVRAALAELPVIYREPLSLYYLGERSYREIAAELEVPLGTVMSRLSRGKELLRDRLEPRRIVPHDFTSVNLAAA